jgi:competence protein ComEC
MTLAYLAGAFLLGLLAAAIAGDVWWPGVGAIGVAGLASAAFFRRPTLGLLGFACAGLFVAGGARYLDERPPDERGGISTYNVSPDVAGDATPIRFRALVADEPQERGRSQRVRLDVREVYDPEHERWLTSAGAVLMRRGLFPEHDYGDVLEVEGVLETPPSFPDFDYRDYLARQGVVSMIEYPEVRTIGTGEGNASWEALYALRGRLADALEQALPEPHAALAQGMLLGERASIPQWLTDDMNATGTSHLIAISGYNVNLVAALVIGAFAWLIGRRQAALVALLAIAWYTALSGASPSVVRAAIMGSLFVVATLAGRPNSALTSIILAAALMAAWSPVVVQEVSFQLSFASVIGIVYLTPALTGVGADALRRAGIEPGEAGIAGGALEVTATTLAAIAATLPLIALNFGRVSAVAPLANLVMVPAFPIVLATSAITAIGGAVWAPLGQVAGWIAWAPLTFFIECAGLFASLPLASLHLEGFGAGWAAAAYVTLAALGWALVQRHGARVREARAGHAQPVRVGSRPLRPAYVFAAAVGVVAAMLWWSALGSSTTFGSGGHLTLTVLDVGQGDAMLLETPAGQRVLIDGGPSGEALTAALGRELPFWGRSLDLVVLTHPDGDHVAGLIEALDRYDARRVLATPAIAESAAYREWREAVRREGAPYSEGRPGERIDLGGGAVLRVLGPSDETLASGNANDASLVLHVSMGSVSFLLTGDIEAGGEEALLASGADLRAQVLKVAHHGSATSSSSAFLRAVAPSVAVISVGEGNTFGHPSPEVVDRLADSAAVLRTDQHGDIELSTDGRRLWVNVER